MTEGWVIEDLNVIQTERCVCCIYAHQHMHRNVHTNISTYMFSSTYTHKCAHNICTCMCLSTYTHKCSHQLMHINVHTNICTYTCPSTYTHKCAHQHMHTITIQVIDKHNSVACFSDKLPFSRTRQHEGLQNTSTQVSHVMC